jgi:hypothetical protein
MNTQHNLKSDVFTTRRNTLLNIVVQEYNIFDRLVDEKEIRANELKQEILNIRKDHSEIVAKNDVEIDELKIKVAELNRELKAKEEEVHALKSLAKHQIEAAVMAERFHQQKREELRAKCSKLRSAHIKVIDDLQLKLNSIKRDMDADNSDVESNIDENNSNGDNIINTNPKQLSSGDDIGFGSSDESNSENMNTNLSANRETDVQSIMYRCEEIGCKKAYKSKSALQKHSRTHKIEKPYICDFVGCNSAFFQKCDLVRHKGTHTDAQPYVCVVCDKKFNQRGNLNVHMKSHK